MLFARLFVTISIVRVRKIRFFGEKMKKVLIVFCMIMMGIAVALNGGATFVVAKEQEVNSLIRIEKELERLDTDVVSELEKQKKDYERRLILETDEKKIEQLQNLISKTDGLIESYKNQPKKLSNSSKKADLSERRQGDIEPTFVPKDADVFFYENSVSAVVAYFYANEYYLSAELLTHARYNRTYASIYTPVNVGCLETSTEYAAVCENKDDYGASAFVKAGSVQDKDLFYSMHNFRYAKFQGGSVVTVYDKYDFAFDGGFDFIDDIPIKVMYMAQEKGVIVPFNVVIEKRLDGDAANRLNENYPMISYIDGEYHIYKDGCSESCEVNHSKGKREGVGHADIDMNGVCDLCAKRLSVEPLPEQPSSEKNSFDSFVDGVKETFNGVKDSVTGFIQENLAGCSGSVGVSVGGITAFGFGACLLLKKKER